MWRASAPGTYDELRWRRARPQATGIGIQVTGASAANPDEVVLQFDQPFYTSTGRDLAGRTSTSSTRRQCHRGIEATANNVATQTPEQILQITLVRARLQRRRPRSTAAPTPAHVVFYATGDGGFEVPAGFRLGGQYLLPLDPRPQQRRLDHRRRGRPLLGRARPTPTPGVDHNEPFSSTGPVYHRHRLRRHPCPPGSSYQKPDLSGPDGGSTSFVLRSTRPDRRQHDAVLHRADAPLPRRDRSRRSRASRRRPRP